MSSFLICTFDPPTTDSSGCGDVSICRDSSACLVDLVQGLNVMFGYVRMFNIMMVRCSVLVWFVTGHSLNLVWFAENTQCFLGSSCFPPKEESPASLFYVVERL